MTLSSVIVLLLIVLLLVLTLLLLLLLFLLLLTVFLLWILEPKVRRRCLGLLLPPLRNGFFNNFRPPLLLLPLPLPFPLPLPPLPPPFLLPPVLVICFLLLVMFPPSLPSPGVGRLTGEGGDNIAAAAFVVYSLLLFDAFDALPLRCFQHPVTEVDKDSNR